MDRPSTTLTWIYYFLSYTLCVSIALFVAYIPAIQAAPEHLYDSFLRGRIFVSFVGVAMASGFFLSATMIIIAVIYQINKKMPPMIWAYVPYVLVVALFGWLYIDANIHPPAPQPKAEGLPPWHLGEDPITYALRKQFDAGYFFSIVGLGFVFLLLFKPFRWHFAYLASDFLHTRTSSVRKVSGAGGAETTTDQHTPQDTGGFIDHAEKLANTFAEPPTVKEAVPVSVEFFAFVYGEGFDYVIVDDGYTIPFMFDDDDEIDSLHGGMYLHINKALYIRFDQIVYIDLKALRIGISPSLVTIFDQIQRKAVKEKIASYRFKAGSPDSFKIHPDLVRKLEKKLRRFSR